MKKILLTMITVTSLGLVSKAQTYGFNQGDVILEGAIHASSTDNKNTEIRKTDFSLTPKVGYFVSDKAAVGIQVMYLQSKNTNYSGSNDTYSKQNGVGAGIFGRYYFLEPGARLKLYGEAMVGYTSLGGETGNGTTTIKSDKTNTIGADLGLGANFFLTPKIAIGYQFANILGFNTTKLDVDGAKAQNNFYLNLNSFENFFSTGQFSLTFKL